MSFFRNIEGYAKSREFTMSKWRMVKYPENIWVNIRTNWNEKKKKKEKWEFRITHFWGLVDIHSISILRNFARPRIIAHRNNISERWSFAMHSLARCVRALFFHFSFPRILRVHSVADIDGLKSNLAIVTRDARGTDEEDRFRKRKYLRG